MFSLTDIFKNKQSFIGPHGRVISRDHFISQVLTMAQGLSAEPIKKVNLYIEDAYLFSVCFFASILSGKEVTLFANNKHIQKNSFEDDIWLTDATWKRYLSGDSRFKTLYLNSKAKVFFYTSGSSGKPKKIEKTFFNLFEEAKVLENKFGEKTFGFDVVASVSHNHIYGFLFKILWPLMSGKKIVIENCRYQEDLFAYSKNNKFIFISSPAFFKRLDDRIGPPEGLKCVFSSGGLLLKKLSDQVLLKLKSRPIEVLGSTETGGVAYRVQDNEHDLWELFGGVEAEPTETHQLRVISPFILKKSFVMGDRVEFVSKNKFKLLGRSDRIVKIEDKRVSLVEIEINLCGHEYVSDCAVLALEISGRQQTGAIIVLSPSGLLWSKGLSGHQTNQFFREFLAESFDLISVPRRFRYVSEIHINSQAKRDFQELERVFL